MSLIRKRKLPRAEVLVVGAGPVGMFTALRLAQRGVEVVVIEQAFSPASHAYALALHPRTLELMEEAGIAGPVLRHAQTVNRIVFYDEHEARMSISLNPLSDCHGYMASLGQDLLEAQLMSALEQAGVRLFWRRRLAGLQQNDQYVTVDVQRLGEQGLGYAVAHTSTVVEETEQYSYPFLIGADGHNSVVRRQLGIDFHSLGRPDSYAVGEFHEDAGHDVCVALSRGTVNELWPLRDGCCRWSLSITEAAPYYSRVKERSLMDSGDVTSPTHQMFQNLVRERAPWYSGSLQDLRWEKKVRFDRRLVTRFGMGRVWMAGDAAHMSSPLAIQSMNIGMQEGDRLAELISHSLKSKTSSYLEAYEAERQTEWKSLTSGAQELIKGRDVDPWIAEHIGEIFSCLPINGSQLSTVEPLLLSKAL